MDGMIIPILVAFSVAMFVFFAVQIVAALTNGEKRKLKERLSVENRDNANAVNRSITIQQFNAGVFGGSKSGLFAHFTWSGRGKYTLRASLGAGNLVLRK